MNIQITVSSHRNGQRDVATFLCSTWDDMAPVARVLAIHDQCRKTLQGQPFDVVTTRKKG